MKKELLYRIVLAVMLTALLNVSYAGIRYVKPAASGTGDGSSWGNANGLSSLTHWGTNAGFPIFGASNTLQDAGEAPSCLITGSNSACGASQATFTAPSGMSSYLWSISGNASISGSATGESVTVNVFSSGSFTLSLTITDASNSSANCSKMVSITAASGCSVSGPNLVCNNTPGYIYLAPGGMSSYLWVVNGPATLVGSNTGSSVSVTSGFAGAFQVQVTVTDANGCSRTCSTLGGNLPGPSCFIEGPATSCSNSTSNTFRSLSNFGITSYNWSISGNATIVGSTTGSSISVSAGSSGSYTVSLTLTNNDNCTTSCSETVNITAPPTCMIGGPTNVCGNSISNVFTAPAGMSSYSWSLTGDATITSSTNVSSITVDAGASGSFTLGLNITDANGCSSTCSLPMTITQKPTVIANINTQTICSNSSITTIVPTPSDGAGISWTRDNEAAVTGIPASGTGNISGTLVNNTNAPILVTFTITASVNGCHSEPVVSTVLVNAVPACPSLFSPANGQLGVQANVGSLDWNDVPYATSYLVYLGTNAPDYNNVINGTSVSLSNISIGTLTDNTSYGFRIVPVNGCGQATSCTAVTFSTCATTFNCPANRDVNLNSNCALVVPDLVTGLAANPGCSSLTFTQNPTAGTMVPSSHNGTVLVEITPDNPAVASCTVILTGKDVAPPTITCTAAQTVAANAMGGYTLADFTGLASVADNCPASLMVTQSPVAGSTLGVGRHTISLTATDGSTNTADCNFTLTVETVVSGRVVWEHDLNTPVAAATVTLSGDDAGSDDTDASGDYELETTGGNLTVTPTKNDNPRQGVDAADVARIRQHALGTLPFNDGYKVIAADVNESNSVTSVDAVIIQQALLGNAGAGNLLDNPAWRFVEAAHTFANENAPWGFPSHVALTGVAEAMPDVDFVGLKMGDVNGSGLGNIALTSQPATWLLPDAALEAGSTHRVAFALGEDLNDVAAWQFTLRLDPAYATVNRITPKAALPLTREDFGTENLLEGELRTVFAQAQGQSLKAGEVVFELELTVRRSALLSEVLTLDNDILDGRVYDTALKGGAVKLAFGPVRDKPGLPIVPTYAEAAFELYQNVPNPVAEETMIAFSLPADATAMITIHDASGRVVAQLSGDYAAGYNTVRLTRDVLKGATGVLTYTVTAGTYTATRRMLVVE